MKTGIAGLAALAGLGIVALAAMAGRASSEPSVEQASPPPAGRARVYVYRVDAWPPIRADAIFSINGTKIAALRANQYTWFYVPEGSFRVEQSWDVPHPATETSRQFSAQPGATYYFRLAVVPGVRQTTWQLRDMTSLAPTGELSKCDFQPPLMRTYGAPVNAADVPEQLIDTSRPLPAPVQRQCMRQVAAPCSGDSSKSCKEIMIGPCE